MLAMDPLPWRVMMISLRTTCLLLLAALAFLFLTQQSGTSEHLRISQCFQEYAQLSLLLGGLLPVLLEEQLASNSGNRSAQCDPREQYSKFQN